VIVLNIIFVILSSLDLIEGIIQSNSFIMAFNAINVVVSAGAIIGARRYNIWLVGFALFWILLNFSLTIWGFISKLEQPNSDVEEYLVYSFIALKTIIDVLYVYPHAAFIYEVKSGMQR
jgi:hypothetical protein